ncbi:hypothetical protein CspeluHIS016_0103830 [Cutaneotrichosporon spelunceum]|uniref:Uncharacterized protein n=1 Tax=Cutaneotrichosporon spelunceum TaxID=1672016 RepID=A0AAD3Y9H1_9TREE|nr:hypothetical protein CspeluHIS016_0103830 [Cutaneotrichosporon spelunceum]
MLDILDEEHPYILQSVVAATPPDSLLSLRAASVALRDSVDARLAAHVLLWADGRVSSRLLPTGRLPRPLSALADRVKTLDVQAPPLRADNARASASALSHSGPTCRCGWTSTPPHDLPPLPHLETVRRWGAHTCWAPPAPRTVTHYGPALDADSGHVPERVVWYLHSPAAVSRFNRLDVGDAPRYVIGGARTGALFDMIDELGVKAEVESADAQAQAQAEGRGEVGGEHERRGKGSGEGESRRRASVADHFGALLAMLWLLDHDEDGVWTLVDAESWPQWEGRGDVEAAIRGRVARCCVVANWDKKQLEGIERKLRFLSLAEYEAEIGEVAALEGDDDHGWRFG